MPKRPRTKQQAKSKRKGPAARPGWQPPVFGPAPEQVAFKFAARRWHPRRLILTARGTGRKIAGKAAMAWELCLQCEELFEKKACDRDSEFVRRCRNCRRQERQDYRVQVWK